MENIEEIRENPEKENARTFFIPPTKEMLKWCLERYNVLKLTHNLTHKKLAELSNMPQGTVDRILSGKYDDFKYSTIQPMVSALLNLSGESADNDAASQAANSFLTDLKQVNKEKDHLIHALEERIEFMEADHTEKVDFLKKRLKRSDKIIRSLGICVGILVALIVTIFVIDKLNPNVGWFRDAIASFSQSASSSLAL